MRRPAIPMAAFSVAARPNHALQRTEAGGGVSFEIHVLRRQPPSLSLSPLGPPTPRSMKRLLLWTLAVAVVGSLVWVLCLPLSPRGILFSGPAVVASVRTQAAVLACQHYSEQHAGRLPSSLQELGPEFRSLWEDAPSVYLATPGASLSGLPAQTVVLFSAGTDTTHHQTLVFVVHPDWRIENHPSR